MPRGLTVATYKNGPIRATIEAQGPALSLFSAKERRAIIQSTMLTVALSFIASLLPKRFTNYARAFLGYRASGKYEKAKSAMASRGKIVAPQPTPLVYTGASRNNALSGARAQAVVVGDKKAQGIVRFPRGAVNFKKADVLQTVPSIEYSFLANQAEKELARLIGGGRFSGKNSNGKRMILGAARPRTIQTGKQRKVS